MTVPAIDGRSRPDLRPVAGEPGVYTHGRHTYISDAEWARWEAQRKRENNLSAKERDARRERDRIERTQTAIREAQKRERVENVHELQRTIAELRFDLRVAECTLALREAEIRAVARDFADILGPVGLRARLERARSATFELAAAAA